ncbi:hypothetical protein ACSS6W_003269 [Trichoderma asperelloides]
MPSADVEGRDAGGKEGRDSIAAAPARVHYSTATASLGTEQSGDAIGFKRQPGGNAQFIQDQSDWRGKTSYNLPQSRGFKRLRRAIAKSKSEKARRAGYLTKKGKRRKSEPKDQEVDGRKRMTFSLSEIWATRRQLHVGQLAGGV